jgi:hypothetical protein
MREIVDLWARSDQGDQIGQIFVVLGDFLFCSINKFMGYFLPHRTFFDDKKFVALYFGQYERQ